MNDAKPTNSDSSDCTTRRTFIKTAVATGVALAASSHLACAPPGEKRGPETRRETKPPEEKPPTAGAPPAPQKTYKDVRIAYIGTGGIGGWHLEETSKLGVSCPCYCDVDTTHFAKAAELFPNARQYQDYRQMFDKESKNFDAVMIGIPDHQHYPATIIAMQHGKHVYTQKPLTHTPWEARQLTEAAKKYKVATQMGNQGHSMEGWRLVYEWIKAGAIGQIKETHTWTNRPIWPQGLERPEGEDAVPSNLNWDVWLGPAPVRPFKNKAYHPFAWRGWWDFGAGALGDMACHTWDGVFAILDPGYPTSIEPVAATPITADAFPNASVLKWEFAARKGRAAFTAYWYDGQLKPPYPKELELDRRFPEGGNLFIGTKGKILVSGDYLESPAIIPYAKQKEIGKPKQLLERSPGQFLEWIMAVAGEKPIDYPKSNFAYAGPFTESVLLGNIALRMGRKLEWDGKNMKFTNVPEANQYISKEYRAGWKP